MSAVVCGSDGQQRLVVLIDGWWVVVDPDTRGGLSGGFKTEAAAKNEARRLGDPR